MNAVRFQQFAFRSITWSGTQTLHRISAFILPATVIANKAKSSRDLPASS